MIGLVPLAAEAPLPDAGSLVLVLAAASAGAILSRIHPRIILPTVVLEITLGILIGPEGFDLAQVDSHIDFLSNLGLVFLFFFAGLELVEHHVARRSLVRGTTGWRSHWRWASPSGWACTGPASTLSPGSSAWR